jgi:hypothetical protein
MHRLLSISAVLAVIISAGAPDVVFAYAAPNMPMMCHLSVLHDSGSEGMTHQHCHNMEGTESSPDWQHGSSAVIGLAGAKCPMECCTLAGPAGHAATVSTEIPAVPIVMRGSASVSKVAFSRNGFSSHTDRGPPTA